MEAILEPLVRSPKLRLYVDELTETLRREQQAREQFRDSLTEDTRAEFINGQVFMHSPARDVHITTVRNISRLLDVWVSLHSLGVVRSEQALAEFTRNDYAPDICFWSAEKARSFGPQTLIYPVPDFICEVLSPSTQTNDRGVKLEDYEAHGVHEYWIADPEYRTIEVYLLEGDRFGPPTAYREGIVKSQVITDFAIPVPAGFDNESNLTALRAILEKKPETR